MSAHALLSASSAHRWIACPPSARLEEKLPDSSSIYAEEGTHAHAWAEMRLKHYFTPVSRAQRKKDEDELKANEYHSAELEDAVEVYIALTKSKYKEARKLCPDAEVFIEQKLQFDTYVPEGFGTVDFILVTDKVLEVVDYKHGKGVSVSAVDNPQMRLYALGALDRWGFLRDFETVRMTICQPRIDNISTDEVSITELLSWAESDLKPAAGLAYEGDGECATGDHCLFCKAKAICRAYSEKQLELAREAFALESPQLLSNGEVAHILNRRDEFKKWLDSVYAHALARACGMGEQYPGYKLVEGRSNRKYVNEQYVIDHLTGTRGYDLSQLTETALIGLTKLTKLIGKNDVTELEEKQLIFKPPGEPTLVPESDKRPAINTLPDEFKEAI